MEEALRAGCVSSASLWRRVGASAGGLPLPRGDRGAAHAEGDCWRVRWRRSRRNPLPRWLSRPIGPGARCARASAQEKVQALIVVLAGLQDPGNLGTIVRSAEALGQTEWFDCREP